MKVLSLPQPLLLALLCNISGVDGLFTIFKTLLLMTEALMNPITNIAHNIGNKATYNS